MTARDDFIQLMVISLSAVKKFAWLTSEYQFITIERTTLPANYSLKGASTKGGEGFGVKPPSEKNFEFRST